MMWVVGYAIQCYTSEHDEVGIRSYETKLPYID